MASVEQHDPRVPLREIPRVFIELNDGILGKVYATAMPEVMVHIHIRDTKFGVVGGQFCGPDSAVMDIRPDIVSLVEMGRIIAGAMERECKSEPNKT